MCQATFISPILPFNDRPRAPPLAVCTSKPPSLPPLSALRSALRSGDVDSISSSVSAAEAVAPQPDVFTDARLTGVWRIAQVTSGTKASPLQRAILGSSFIPPVTQAIVGFPPEAVVTTVDLRAPIGARLTLRADVERMKGMRLYVRFVTGWFDVDRWPAWLGGMKWIQRVRLPYPVPFDLLGDRARAWVDVTVLEDDLRVTRGSRGSCFVLNKLEDTHDEE